MGKINNYVIMMQYAATENAFGLHTQTECTCTDSQTRTHISTAGENVRFSHNIIWEEKKIGSVVER